MSLAAEIIKARDKDEQVLTSVGVVAARRVSAKLKARTLAAYVRGDSLPLRDIVVQDLFPTVLDTMVAMHLRGEQMQRALYRRTQFSTAEERLKQMLAKLANPQRLAMLRKRYQADALKILDDAGTKVEKTLRKTVNELIAEGSTTRDGIGVLGAKFDDLGLTPKNSFQLETIYRTQSQIAYGAGRWEADQDPDIQSILWGYEYSTVGDDRVRPEHAALDGVKLPKEDPFWQRFWPPNGYNCRCIAIPVFETVQIKRPPRFVPGTDTVVQPDPGFAFNAGAVLAS